eukprot:Skav236342  [mRNA]  locus=scaffold918:33454:39358:- [translate_table: standard]
MAGGLQTTPQRSQEFAGSGGGPRWLFSQDRQQLRLQAAIAPGTQRSFGPADSSSWPIAVDAELPTCSQLQARKFLEPRPRYLGYAEYASWVSAAVPDAELRPSPLETSAAETGLTGLELLRKAPKKGVPQITAEELEGGRPGSAQPHSFQEKQLAEDALYGPGSADEAMEMGRQGMDTADFPDLPRWESRGVEDWQLLVPAKVPQQKNGRLS